MQRLDEPVIQSCTRRGFFGFCAAVALLILGLFPQNPVLPEDDELIIMNGWILRKSDLIGSPQ